VKNWIKSKLYPIGLMVAPSLLLKMQHLRMHRRFGSHWYWPNLRKPRTFNERLLSSKLAQSHCELGPLVDKGEVKFWVAKKIGQEFLIPTIGLYTSPGEVPLNDLPRPCILKPTHASGHVLILDGRSDEPRVEVIRKELGRWLRLNHWAISGEPQYRNIPPRIICEPLLGGGDELPDYKFFCFHGEPAVVQVDVDRHTRHARRFYDMEWRPQNFRLRYAEAEREVQKPTKFELMKKIATNLSRDQEFVRVDLYEVEGAVYFGELTFHPESGVAPFSSRAIDLEFGRLMGHFEES